MEVLPDVLKPDLELLQKEYVLVQAWKKTSNYIRYHNWYADTLELDWITVNLPEFLSEIAEYLESPNDWVSDPLRLVPAPKSQQWHINKEGWQPEKRTNETRLRPLAHVSPRDQVIATAMMLCIADRIETIQGDPRSPLDDADKRRRVSSYGNRLFCDLEKGQLRHRWGSSKLYRAYFQDYRSFIARPGVVAESIQESGRHVYVIESDLSQFYDRVRPEDLLQALRKFQSHEEEQTFFDFAERILDWRWDHRDARDVRAYAAATKLEDFHRIALPQGLVSAGFFANVLLIPFDERLRDSTGKDVIPDIRLEDACRYVDDLRLVVSTSQTRPDLKDAVYEWIQSLLTAESSGLSISYDKTHAGEFGGSQRPFVRQSRRMERIQSAISGGFDAIAGAAILEAVQGLVRSQEAFNRDSVGEWEFSPLPDVRDETIARFAAARFRTTYRSIRPLLEAGEVVDHRSDIGDEDTDTAYLPQARTKLEHDDDARAFSLWLIERWIADPSNVRLLRIGLDIWPDSDVLEAVLSLLRPFTQPGGRRKLQRRVALYCLSELLRAGATETGFVSDKECLSEDIDLRKFRNTLRDEAVRLVGLSAATVPWYLRQQSLLFLAAFDPTSAPIFRAGRNPETMRYRRLILFLRGEQRRLPDSDFATLSVLQRRSFVDDSSIELQTSAMPVARRMEIAVRDPSFAVELSRSNPSFFDGLSNWLREDACVVPQPKGQEWPTLARVVLDGGSKNPLRNELSLLRFAEAFVSTLSQSELGSTKRVSPEQVQLKLQTDPWADELLEMEMLKNDSGSAGSFYAVPNWCAPVDRWRFQLGFLLRFILAARPDFTLATRRHARLSNAYRPCKSHWYQRVYGLFNGQEAFGDDWLPITDWMEQFLLALLRWPGCRLPSGFEWVHSGAPCALSKIKDRIRFLRDKRGPASVVSRIKHGLFA